MTGTIKIKDVLPVVGVAPKIGSWENGTEIGEINVVTAYVGNLYPLNQTGYNGVWVHGSFYPVHDLFFDLGLPTNRWLKGWIQTIYASIIDEMVADAGVTIEGVLCKDGAVTPTNGASGSFTSADVPPKTVTVTNGIITSIV